MMPLKRRHAREWAVQMLVAADFNPEIDMTEMVPSLWEEIAEGLGESEDDKKLANQLRKVAASGDGNLIAKLKFFAEERVLGVLKNCAKLDEALIPLLREDWSFDRLGMVERAVLRLAAWEMMYSDVPAPIVINEAIDLANWFGTPRSRSLINGILDALRRKVRPE